MQIEAGESHKYSCVMANLPPIMTMAFNKMKKRLARRHWHEVEMADMGQPHVTVLYGLHKNVTPAEVAEVLLGRPDPIIQFLGTEIFETPKYDVLVARVKSDELRIMNRLLRNNLPYTNKYPDYKPHVTIGYLKKGRGRLFQNFDVGIAESRRFRLTDIVFSAAESDTQVPI